MVIVPIYAAVLALLFVALSVRTLRMRRRLRIAVGDAGHPALLRAMRAHANFAEYVPLSLLLISFVELGGASALLVNSLAAALLLGRAAHAFGISRVDENFVFRVFGMVLTLSTLIVAALCLLLAQAGRIGA